MLQEWLRETRKIPKIDKEKLMVEAKSLILSVQ